MSLIDPELFNPAAFAPGVATPSLADLHATLQVAKSEISDLQGAVVEEAEENDTDTAGAFTVQATGPAVLRKTLTGDATILVAGAPTPGKGWSVELRTTQDGSGGRDVTILPANHLTYSLDLQSTAEAGETRPWGDQNTSLDDNAGTGPDGRVNLTKIIEDSATTFFGRDHVITGLSPNQELTAAVVVKDDGDSRNVFIRLIDQNSAANQIWVVVNPATGAVVSGPTNAGNGANAAVAVTALENGCFLVTLTGQPNTSGSNTVLAVRLWNGASSSYAGDGVSGVLVGNVQVNIGGPIGLTTVGATRAGMVTWRTAADEIDYAAQAASAESRIIIGVGSDGEILIDNVSIAA